MKQQELLSRYHCPRYQELPSLQLYKDQVVEELNRYLQPLRCGEITATMVNNYVKVKAIPAPEKKRYGREQLAGLYLICLLKQVYSIGEITTMLSLSYASEDFGACYDAFCDELEKVFRCVFTGAPLPEEPPTMFRAVACSLAYKLYAVQMGRLAVRQRAQKQKGAE